MQCEVCGAESKRLVEIALEGAQVLACPRCAQLGKVIPRKPLSADKKSTYFYHPSPRLEIGLEVVEGFAELVRKAREKKGLTREQLARKIFEKESVIHRIESGNYVPDDKTVKKLEEALGVKLTE